MINVELMMQILHLKRSAKAYRAVYENRAIVYEEIPKSFKIQFRQKMRRATGLIEATLSNLDLLGEKTPFSRFFYPLRIFIYLATPLLFFVGLVFFSIGIFLYNPIVVLPLLFVLVLLGIFWRQNLFFAFVINQFIFLRGLESW